MGLFIKPLKKSIHETSFPVLNGAFGKDISKAKKHKDKLADCQTISEIVNVVEKKLSKLKEK
jgi:hypothetical protein